MRYIDFHCDTMLKYYLANENRQENETYHVTSRKLATGQCLIQCLAHFDDRERSHYSFPQILDFIKNTDTLIANIPLYKKIGSVRETDVNKVNVMYTVEDAGSLNSNIDRIKVLYDMGVRIIGLTWNYQNCLASPNSSNMILMNSGLTPFGMDAVDYMDELGIIVDVSHISDKSFYDVAKRMKRPFIASHSNARGLTFHPRNLTDPMIKLLAEKGGVIGVNFAKNFLGNADITRIDDIVAHIKYIADVGGIDVVALGSDFDGIEDELEIKDASGMPLLAEALSKAGFSTGDVEKIFFANAFRVLRQYV